MKTLITLLLLCPVSLLADATMLAKLHHDDIEVSEYLVSEKLDGIRARWTGTRLLSRNGNPIHAPAGFTRHFPDATIDGELWIGRGQFQQVTQVVLDDQPDEVGWKQVRYMIFDLPGHSGPFSQRVEAMRQLVASTGNPQLQMIPQNHIDNAEALMEKLRQVETGGGEGLMLHHRDNRYRDGRSDGLLKLKSFADAEATVTGYTQGKGRFAGMVGALKVVTAEGLEFRIGSGLNHQDRQSPPAIGSIITYKYFGLTDSGKPRFASYLRTRSPPTLSTSSPVGGSDP